MLLFEQRQLLLYLVMRHIQELFIDTNEITDSLAYCTAPFQYKRMFKLER